jgi:hydrogenase/urease accessory protein HupE
MTGCAIVTVMFYGMCHGLATLLEVCGNLFYALEFSLSPVALHTKRKETT